VEPTQLGPVDRARSLCGHVDLQMLYSVAHNDIVVILRSSLLNAPLSCTSPHRSIGRVCVCFSYYYNRCTKEDAKHDTARGNSWIKHENQQYMIIVSFVIPFYLGSVLLHSANCAKTEQMTSNGRILTHFILRLIR
jgi:hypothetical protein